MKVEYITVVCGLIVIRREIVYALRALYKIIFIEDWKRDRLNEFESFNKEQARRLVFDHKQLRCFTKKNLYDLLVLLGRRSSCITSTHLLLFTLLETHGDSLSPSECLRVVEAHEWFSQKEKEQLSEMLSTVLDPLV